MWRHRALQKTERQPTGTRVWAMELRVKFFLQQKSLGVPEAPEWKQRFADRNRHSAWLQIHRPPEKLWYRSYDRTKFCRIIFPMRQPILEREEYIEQEYFYRVYRERLLEGVASQEILQTIHEELLATTRLPMAIDFLRAEIMHNGRISEAMSRLPHYFSAFQAFVMNRAEDDESRFEQRVALRILEQESHYRAAEPRMAGLFIYQLECIARHRLGYTDGLRAMASDPVYSDEWTSWIRRLAANLGTRELSELIFQVSEHFYSRRSLGRANMGGVVEDRGLVLFGEQEGRIARANIGRDPLYLFAALQRHLGYPSVPQTASADATEKLPGFLEARLQKIEQKMKILEMETKGGIDLSRFYKAGEHAAATEGDGK